MPTVRFIDPLFIGGNPSVSGLVRIVPRLIEAGWNVEIWASRIDPSLGNLVSHRKLPSRRAWLGFGVWLSFFDIHLRALGDLLLGRDRPDVTVSTGFYYLPADIAAVHFSHVDWLKALFRKGFSTSEAWVRFFASISGFATEAVFLWNPWRVLLLPVSDSVAADMARYAAPWKTIRVLPNLAHPEFNSLYRVASRLAARELNQIPPEEITFAFASAGHHYRKGFREAVIVTDHLRKAGHPVRLLVIGGYPKSLARQVRWIASKFPNFGEWTTFTGAVDNVNFHLSAADALLFPSACEAFSLVSIEAAALGLPLYLTRHHGSEMTLGAGVPGKFLPWDVSGMATVLDLEIVAGNVKPGHSQIGRALDLDDFTQHWIDTLNQAISAPDKRF